MRPQPTIRLCLQCELPVPAKGGRQYHEECKLLTVNRPRRCKRCKQVKTADSFSRDAGRAEGRFPWCKDCQHSNSQDKAFQDEAAPLNGRLCPLDDTPVRGAKNRLFCSLTCKDRVGRLRTKFNLGVKDFRRMVEATGGLCPICGQRPTVWQVDHDHKTNLVTGVVCINCNVGLLAASGHNPDRVLALWRYLNTTPASTLGIVAIVDPAKHRPSQLHRVWGHAKTRTK